MFIHNLSVIVGVGPKPLDIKTMDWIAFRMTGRGLGADQYNGASCHPTKEGKLACWTTDSVITVSIWLLFMFLTLWGYRISSVGNHDWLLKCVRLFRKYLVLFQILYRMWDKGIYECNWNISLFIFLFIKLLIIFFKGSIEMYRGTFLCFTCSIHALVSVFCLHFTFYIFLMEMAALSITSYFVNCSGTGNVIVLLIFVCMLMAVFLLKYNLLL